MMCWYLLLLFFSMPGLAQSFSATDLRQLKVYSAGLFSDDGPLKADIHSIKSGLKVQTVWRKRKDGIWLFAEKTDTTRYYQVWHFYLQDDTTLLMQFLDFKNSAKAVQPAGISNRTPAFTSTTRLPATVVKYT